MTNDLVPEKPPAWLMTKERPPEPLIKVKYNQELPLTKDYPKPLDWL